jgi:hypothetical protein
MGTGTQFFEAIVTDPAPDSSMPGFIKVKIPELFGQNELPHLVGPVYPGWTAGGWHSVPSASLPSSVTDETDVRVLVVKLAPYVYRYVGTTQGWDAIEADPGAICGARSPDGKHTILLDADGLHLSAFEDNHTIDVLTNGVVITSSMTKIGSSSATNFAAMANLVDQAFSTLRSELLTHVHPTAAPGPPSVPIGIGATSSSTACTKVKIE